jgi:hypothetical protein
MQKMKSYLPIPAKATNTLIRNRVPIRSTFRPNPMEIADVMYMGDEGGISCALKVLDQEEVAVVVSINHLRLPKTYPLSSDVRDYQITRTKKLAGGHDSNSHHSKLF